MRLRDSPDSTIFPQNLAILQLLQPQTENNNGHHSVYRDALSIRLCGVEAAADHVPQQLCVPSLPFFCLFLHVWGHSVEHLVFQ